jgi:hypothetical protein
MADPTAAELTSEHRPYLPRNALARTSRGAAGPEPEEAAAKHLETHFRLLRHDVVGPLQEGLQAVLRAVKPGRRGSRPLRVRGANTMSFVFHDARVDGCGGEQGVGVFFTVRTAPVCVYAGVAVAGAGLGGMCVCVRSFVVRLDGSRACALCRCPSPSHSSLGRAKAGAWSSGLASACS